MRVHLSEASMGAGAWHWVPLLALACASPEADRQQRFADSVLATRLDGDATGHGLTSIHGINSGSSHTLRFWVIWAFDSSLAVQVSKDDAGWRGMTSRFVHSTLTVQRSAVTWDSARTASVLSLVRGLPRRPSRPRALEARDACVFIIEEHQDSAYHLWFYDHPDFFTTPADTGAGVLFSQALGWSRSRVHC